MIFDLNKYPGNYAMHCKTAEEAESFCQYLHENGRKWVSGGSYVCNTNYYYYDSETAYSFNTGCYCNCDFYRRAGYTILEWSDYMADTVLNDTRYLKYIKEVAMPSY